MLNPAPENLSLSSLESMAKALYVYDVDQNGWEGDPEGASPKTADSNLVHVSLHLADVIERKDFNNVSAAATELAPDAIQYGLRIVRWGGLTLDSVLPAAQDVEEAKIPSARLQLTNNAEAEAGSLNFAFSGFVRASGILARQLHDEDHQSSSQEAIANRKQSLRQVSTLLILSSLALTDYNSDNLRVAFDNRLTQLRQRIHIPEPSNES